jgi:hypothetical protein
MLKLQTDLNMIDRFDATSVATTLIASGFQGTWAVPAATGYTYPAEGAYPAYMIWTEGNYDGTTETMGFTPDTANTGKLTFLAGKYRMKTNIHTGTIAVGDPLAVNTSGELFDAIDETMASGVVAHCIAVEDTDGYITIQTF